MRTLNHLVLCYKLLFDKSMFDNKIKDANAERFFFRGGGGGL